MGAGGENVLECSRKKQVQIKGPKAGARPRNSKEATALK